MDYAKEYGRLHENAKWFQGFSIKPYVAEIARLVESHEPERLLDYGCGKGHQYLVLRVHEAWGGLLPHCYDIGVRGLAEKPEGRFGGVICTDMLEHIAEPDVPATLDDILGRVEPGGFALLGISTRPSTGKKRLSDGSNVHLTVQTQTWWHGKIDESIKRLGSDAEVWTMFDAD